MKRYGVLGPFEVTDGDTAIDLGTPRQRALLIRLVLDANRVVSLDRLIEDLWGDEPPAAATATLQAYVSQLRRALEPHRRPRSPATVLVTQPPGYVLRIDPGALDVEVFATRIDDGRQALAAGKAAEAERAFDDALALWRGEPYEEVQFESFVQVERRRLHELRASAIEDRFAAVLDQGRHRYVMGDIEAFVAQQPYRERAWELLVLARYRSGRQVEALRAYQDARRALIDIGVEPSPRLVGLEQLVIAQDASLEWRPPAPAAATTEVTAPGTPDDMAVRAEERAATDRARGDDQPKRSPLVGRDDALATFDAVVQRAMRGSGGVLLVAGDAGIGKTRLVEEGTTRAASTHGARITWGRSSDGDGAPGYWPWTQALGSLARDAHDDALRAGGALLGHVLPDATDRLGPPPPLPDDPGSARFAVHQAVASFLTATCSDAPTVVVLDDAHWADGSSLRLLGALAADLKQLPVLVVATYRPTEARESTVFTDTMAAVARASDVDRIVLDGLDRDDVAAYLHDAGVPGATALADVVHQRSGGNPFFVTELTRLLLSRSGSHGTQAHDVSGVPHAVHDVIHQRLARLPEASRELLGLAAVGGRDVDVTILALAADLDLDVAIDRLEPAVLTGMLLESADSPGTYRFSHDLVRDAVYAGLTPARRARLHRRIADATVERFGAAAGLHAAALAYHYSAALPLGTAEQALHWSTEAAERALSRAADDEAIVALQLALRAHEAARPDDLVGRFELLVQLGRTRRRVWELADARVAIDAAIDLAVRLDDPVRIARAAAVYGGFNLWTWRAPGEVDHRVVEALEYALSKLDDDVSVDRVRAFGTLAVELYYGDDPDHCEAMADRAVELAEQLGDPAELALALNNAFTSKWRPYRRDDLLDTTNRMLAVPGLDPQPELIARMHRTMLHNRLGDLAAVDADLVRSNELRRAVKMPELAAQLDFALSTRAMMRGALDEAELLLERAWRTRYEQSSMWGGEWCYLLGRLTLLRDRGPVDAIADRLVEMAAGDDYDLIRPTAIVALLEAGRDAEARRLAASGPRLQSSWTWSFSVGLWAEITASLALPGAEQLYELLAKDDDELLIIGSNLACWGAIDQFRGRLSEHLGDRDRAVQQLERAVATHERLELPILEARSRVLLAEALARAGAATDVVAPHVHAVRDVAVRFDLPALAARAAAIATS